MDPTTQKYIESTIQNNDIVLFMKGNAHFPMCGFSARAVQVLNASGADLNDLITVNVLDDDDVRQGIKEFSHWPTIPQLYVKGEFIGGADIMTEMYQNGEMRKLIESLSEEA